MTDEHVAERADERSLADRDEPASQAITTDQDRPAFGARGGEGRMKRPVLATLIVVNTLVALAITVMIIADGGLLGDVLFEGVAPIHEWGEMHGPSVDDGEVWRLVTTMFIHYGLVHLILNMVMLGIAGWKLEPILGSSRFLVLYLLCGFGASVATYYVDHGSLTAGASGANFGVFAALLVVYLRLRLKLWLPGVLVLLGVISTVAIPGMAIAAHAGGLLLGTVLALGYAYAAGDNRAAVQRWVPLATLAILLALAAVGVLTG